MNIDVKTVTSGAGEPAAGHSAVTSHGISAYVCTGHCPPWSGSPSRPPCRRT